jgi:hypothetical protein
MRTEFARKPYCCAEVLGLLELLGFIGLIGLLEFIGLLAFVGFNLCEYQVVGSER